MRDVDQKTGQDLVPINASSAHNPTRPDGASLRGLSGVKARPDLCS